MVAVNSLPLELPGGSQLGPLNAPNGLPGLLNTLAALPTYVTVAVIVSPAVTVAGTDLPVVVLVAVTISYIPAG